jgi:hypothetical protein
MAKRWEPGMLAYVQEHIDPSAVGGRAIRSLNIVNVQLFDSNPEAHPAVKRELRSLYGLLTKSARDDDRLPDGVPLVKRWTLSWDIYSPKLRRFIEVDERQHFSLARLNRLAEIDFDSWGPVYSAYFWQKVFPQLQVRPCRDLKPPHRDEQRAYLDELRDRLPALYGFKPTIRLDEFTLKAHGYESLNQLIDECDIKGRGGL